MRALRSVVGTSTSTNINNHTTTGRGERGREKENEKKCRGGLWWGRAGRPSIIPGNRAVPKALLATTIAHGQRAACRKPKRANYPHLQTTGILPFRSRHPNARRNLLSRLSFSLGPSQFLPPPYPPTLLPLLSLGPFVCHSSPARQTLHFLRGDYYHTHEKKRGAITPALQRRRRRRQHHRSRLLLSCHLWRHPEQPFPLGHP